MSSNSFLYFSVDICPSSIQYVDSDVEVLKTLLENACIIGIDTEYKPTRRKGEFNSTALLQLAIRRKDDSECVALVDLLTISLDPKQFLRLNEILLPIFANPRIVKFGQGLGQDFIQLMHSYPFLSACANCQSLLDTNELHRLIENESIQRDFSLKYFSQHYLHLDLDKSCQMSNWARRPLSARQVEYAVCDALVLLRLYDAMSCEAMERCSTAAIENLLKSFDAIHYRLLQSKKKSKSVNRNALPDRSEAVMLATSGISMNRTISNSELTDCSEDSQAQSLCSDLSDSSSLKSDNNEPVEYQFREESHLKQTRKLKSKYFDGLWSPVHRKRFCMR